MEKENKTEKLDFIRANLIRGDRKKIHLKSKKSFATVTQVLNGNWNNDKIINVALTIIEKRKNG